MTSRYIANAFRDLLLDQWRSVQQLLISKDRSCTPNVTHVTRALRDCKLSQASCSTEMLLTDMVVLIEE